MPLGKMQEIQRKKHKPLRLDPMRHILTKEKVPLPLAQIVQVELQVVQEVKDQDRLPLDIKQHIPLKITMPLPLAIKQHIVVVVSPPLPLVIMQRQVMPHKPILLH